MIKRLLSLIISVTCVTALLAYDLNDDGNVNAGDISELYSAILRADSNPIYDLNSDGNFNAGDISTLYSSILSVSDNTINDNYEWVDLGLTSGTLWATMNIGARTPEEYGYYFAWGETTPKNYYDWDTYKWCVDNFNNLNKYCTDNRFGFVDNKTELDPEDDAAYVNWGFNWRMPTDAQFDELRSECYWLWTSINGVNGYLVSSKLNSASLFLPAAGDCFASSVFSAESEGNYWSRTLYAGETYNAYNLGFGSDHVGYSGCWNREKGYSIRAVRIP